MQWRDRAIKILTDLFHLSVEEAESVLKDCATREDGEVVLHSYLNAWRAIKALSK